MNRVGPEFDFTFSHKLAVIQGPQESTTLPTFHLGTHHNPHLHLYLEPKLKLGHWLKLHGNYNNFSSVDFFLELIQSEHSIYIPLLSY